MCIFYYKQITDTHNDVFRYFLFFFILKAGCVWNLNFYFLHNLLNGNVIFHTFKSNKICIMENNSTLQADKLLLYIVNYKNLWCK
jgi:hypothetical protein